MASGTINMTNTGYMSGRIVWSSTPNVATNTSTITTTLQVRVDIDNLLGKLSDGSSLESARFTIPFSMEASEYDGDYIASKSNLSEYYTIKNKQWNSIATLTFSSLHFNNGSNYVHIQVRANLKSDKGSTTTNGAVRMTLDNIPRGASLTGAIDFNDEGSGYITYSNPAGNSVSKLEAYIYDGDSSGTVLVGPKEISKTGTSATLHLTDAERELIRQRTVSKGVSSLTARYYLKTTIGSTEYLSNQIAKMIYITNATPEIHATYWDADSTCVALTQNSDIFIKGYSNLDFTLEATPKKGASITNYYAAVDYTRTATVPMISGTGTHEPHYNIVNDKVVFSAKDNRGVTGKLELPLDMVDYFPPTCSLSAADIALDEESGTTATAEVEISGEFFNDKFGTDGLQNELKIEILHTGLDDWFEIPDILWGDNVDGNKYKATFTVNGLDYQKAITFQARVSDKLVKEVVSEEKTLTLYPIFDWSENDFNFNVPIKIQGNDLDDFVIKTGTSSMGSNGTWYWRKWASGRAECYGLRNFGNMGVSTAFGSLYRSQAFTQSLPSNLFFGAPESITINVAQASGLCWVAQGFDEDTTKSKIGSFVVVHPVSATLSQVYLGFNVVGRWKE